MNDPIIGTDAAVVLTAEQRQLLIETGFVVTPIDSKRHAFCGHKVVDARGVGSVLHHLHEGFSEVCCKLIPIDGFFGRCAAVVEDKNSFVAYVSGIDESPTNGAARF